MTKYNGQVCLTHQLWISYWISKVPCCKIFSLGHVLAAYDNKWLYPNISKMKINRFGLKSTVSETITFKFFPSCQLLRNKGLIFVF